MGLDARIRSDHGPGCCRQANRFQVIALRLLTREPRLEWPAPKSAVARVVQLPLMEPPGEEGGVSAQGAVLLQAPRSPILPAPHRDSTHPCCSRPLAGTAHGYRTEERTRLESLSPWTFKGDRAPLALSRVASPALRRSRPPGAGHSRMSAIVGRPWRCDATATRAEAAENSPRFGDSCRRSQK